MNRFLLMLISLMFIVFGGKETTTVNNPKKCKMLHDYLQNDNKGIAQIKSYYELDNYPTVVNSSDIYKRFCNFLELDKPEIRIIGWERMDNNILLVELYAEDLSHLGFFLLIIDTDCDIKDFLYLEEPINRDQIEYKDGYSIEWHYIANFNLQKDTIIVSRQHIDIKYKYGEENIDTLYKKHLSSKFLIDLGKGFRRFSIDSIIEGVQY